MNANNADGMQCELHLVSDYKRLGIANTCNAYSVNANIDIEHPGCGLRAHRPWALELNTFGELTNAC
jgi:hypothetical protein